MSQHGCPERLSNRSKGFQEDGSSQPTMEVLVETLTGTAFEMTVSPSDTVFAIKSKIFRVEGIPVSQQHLLYNLKELEDSMSLKDLAIGDGARLRLVLGMRGGPVSTRRLPPPVPSSSEPWPDIERLLDSNRDDIECTSSGCKVTVLVFRDGERVNMLRVKENQDGTYSPVDASKQSSRGAAATEVVRECARTRADNELTGGKMLDLRRRMEALSLQRRPAHCSAGGSDMQKTRSEETLPACVWAEAAGEPYSSYLDTAGEPYAPYLAEDSFADLYDNNYTRYEYECGFERGRGAEGEPRPPRPARHVAYRESRREGEEGPILEECGEEPPRLQPAPDYGPAVGSAWLGGHSASALQLCARPAALPSALLSSSACDLHDLQRNSRVLPLLSRARPRSQLHLGDDAQAPPPPHHTTDKKNRSRCGLCRKRLSIATEHRCRCGGRYCAPHRYAEVHGCAYDYKAGLLADPPLAHPKLPRI